MEDSFESIGEQEAYGGNGEASYYEQERTAHRAASTEKPRADTRRRVSGQ
jgi:hypothetical protein